MNKLVFLLPITLLLLLLLPALTHADCSCDLDQEDGKRPRALSLKLAALFSILTAGFIGVYLPSLGKWLPAISPEKNIFFVIKAFAAGVILSTGFIHILPDAFSNLTSPCLNPHPWQDFPFAGFFAMVAAIGTLVIDTVATGYYNRIHNGAGQVHVHTHANHGHAHGMGTSVPDEGEDLIRRRVISQVMQAKFKIRPMITMIVFFSLTTPVGIAVGIGISSVYHENSPKALIVEGILNSGAAGILIYMALVGGKIQN
ncbi:Zinc transporter 5 [Dendrobium catenatum]|uniref:Zinc transporter 5 n=1 Tax=Dendrobium catenatum TaxID=906689 RepID=A0A2I0VP74_9ASPA|nr:Zinc transporter 5 [Dendrobium catenatum]